MNDILDISVSAQLSEPLDISLETETSQTQFDVAVDLVRSEQVTADGIKPHVYAPTYLEFPNIGTSESLYVATQESAIYMWSDEHLMYFMIGTDYRNIKNIVGGDANG